MKLLVLLILLFGAGFSSNATMAQGCLSYEPATVTLKGKITPKTFAGPPNYESVKKGDTPERYWILHLTRPICINADENIIGGERQEKNVSKIQLVFTEKEYAPYKGLLGKRVQVNGKLWHAHTGHHHTNILLTVLEIKRGRR